jgi:hypothetical protein
MNMPLISKSMVIVITRPNLLYIILFGPYCPHGFVHGDAPKRVQQVSDQHYS